MPSGYPLDGSSPFRPRPGESLSEARSRANASRKTRSNQYKSGSCTTTSVGGGASEAISKITERARLWMGPTDARKPHPTGGGRPSAHDYPDQLKIPVHVDTLRIPSDGYSGSKVGELLDTLASFADDPLGFVKWAFPWGEHNAALENQTGPEPWQAEQLVRVGEAIKAGGLDGCVVEEDTAAGRGVGKSALVSWWILWAIATHADTRGIVTANTDTQLRTKTWAELSKWYQLFIAKSLFTLTATAIYIKDDSEREKSWRIDAIPWSKNTAEAFNGLHNQGKRMLIVFDEASAIDDSIWEGTDGALTDANTQIFWLRYGNPTRTSGRFFNNVTKPRRNTVTRVDGRLVSFTNKALIADWIDQYGEDGDFVRVHVKGMFPRAGFSNFISPELVFQARRRRLDPNIYKPYQKILAIDPARFGDDFSVITLRQGLKVHFQVSLSGFDGPDLAGRVFEIVRKESPISCIVYDAIGNGADLDSSLRRMPGLPPLIPVQWGQPAKDTKQYFNQRSECWGKMRDFLEHGQIPDDDELADQLSSLDYGYSATFQIQLQSKKDCKKNGGKSPDKADSLALSQIPELIDRKIVTAKVRPVVRRSVVWTR